MGFKLLINFKYSNNRFIFIGNLIGDNLSNIESHPDPKGKSYNSIIEWQSMCISELKNAGSWK